MIKIAGTAIIVFCCFMFGEYFGLKTEFRRNQLSEMRLGIGFLTGDMEFNLAPAYISAKNIADRLRDPVKGIFENFSQRLENGESADRAWMRALTYKYDDTFFKAEDIEAIYPLGNILLSMDNGKQERGIEILNGYIDEKIRQLSADENKIKRLCRSCFVLGGIFVAVLLL